MKIISNYIFYIKKSKKIYWAFTNNFEKKLFKKKYLKTCN